MQNADAIGANLFFHIKSVPQVYDHSLILLQMILIYFKEMRGGEIIMVTEGKGSGYHLELKLIYPVEPSVHSVSPQCLVMAEGGSKFLPLPLQKQK